MFAGVDEQGREQPSVELRSGELRESTVYYCNGPEGLSEPGENTVSVTVLGWLRGSTLTWTSLTAVWTHALAGTVCPLSAS